MTAARALGLLVLVVAPGAAEAQAPKAAATPATKKPAKDAYAGPMDYGPYLATSVVRADPKNKPYKPTTPDNPNGPKFAVDPIPDPVALKGIVIPVAENATLCFDTDDLRMAGGWTGGWLDLSGTMLTNHKGTSHVTVAGTEQFRCDGLGWGGGPAGDDFTDPRNGVLGPLPATHGRYKGLYVSGRQVVLSYAAGGADVLEQPGFEGDPAGGIGAFTRTIRMERSAGPLSLALCTVPGASGTVSPDGAVASLATEGKVTAAGVVGAPAGAAFRTDGGRLRLALPAVAVPATFKVLLWTGDAAGLPAFADRVKASAAPVDPKPLTAGGPALWKPVRTAGQVGGGGEARPTARGRSAQAGDGAYVVDTLTLPDDNPYKSWMRLSGLDFLPDGRAAVCTLNGDVWVASGIDDSLADLTWTRFATGLYHPMGLCVVDGAVYVRGRDQLTRLHDLNGDGAADFYENVSSEGMAHPSYHGFVFDVQADAAGNFYYARGGIGMATDLAGHGRMTKLARDGTATTIATGLRAPNGLGVGPGPTPWVTVSDNQGNWIPSSRIHAVDPSRPAAFLGFLPHHHRDKPPADYAPPLVWLPHKLDNSSGGQTHIASDRWGPYRGQWVHTSFGAASVMLMLPDEGPASASKASSSTPPKQAAVVRLPLDFATGIMRPRFSPKDGQFYAAGVGGGWQTKGTRDGALYRVRFTGKPATAPSGFAVVPGGVRLTFPAPLDRAAAADPQNYGVEQWNYKWTEKYGSPDYSARNPDKAGHDAVDVKAVTVSDDGRAVTLQIPDLAPVMQMMIQYNLKMADGGDFGHEVYATINEVPSR